MTCLCSRQSVGVSLDHAACLQEGGGHDKIEEMGLKSKLTLRQGGGDLSVNLTLSVQWVGMDVFPKMSAFGSCQLCSFQQSTFDFNSALKLSREE